MVALALACSALWIAGTPDLSDIDRDAYDAARRQAGRDAEAHVKLALWCEAHGLDDERTEHLATAILADPTHATARGLLGLVGDGKSAEAEAGLAAARAEYVARRGRSPDTAEGHWWLGLWCQRKGLKAEAVAHFTAVTRLDPGRSSAWRRLGFEKYRGRWMTPAQIREAKADRDARERADAYWRPSLAKWKADLSGDDEATREAAEVGLDGVADAEAVPAIWRVFVLDRRPDLGRAARLLGQVESRESSFGLALLAAFADAEGVRRAATETLAARREPGALVALLRDPIRLDVKPVGSPGDPGALLLGLGRFNLLRIYGPEVPEIARHPGVFRGYDQDGRELNSSMLRYDLDVAARVAAAQLEGDLAAVLARNDAIDRRNDRVAGALENVAPGQEIGDVEGWRRWLADRLGYTYQAPRPFAGPTVVQGVESAYPVRSFSEVTSWSPTSCFAAGTPVRTRDGDRPIETLKVGDLVLAQDVADGRLGYRPVVEAFHNLPAPTWKIDLGGESILATGIHRLWVAGKGWAMARDLKPGDRLRTADGLARVVSARRESYRPVFNLEVAEGHTFFVGHSAALVHDNTVAAPVEEPFDAVPDLAPGR